MGVLEDLKNKKSRLAVIGLGYVGMPIAVEFSKHINTVGFDINKEKVELYNQGIDVTNEVGSEIIKNTLLQFTCNETDIANCNFFIVAVPTPINEDRSPNLKPVEGAATIVGRNMTKGSIIVFESTVYPGVTEEVCVPILEKESGLKCGIDFKVGYSPERINPGDKVHTVTQITKIVSGMDKESLEEIAGVYELIVEAGVFKAESIKVAEAAKVIENAQRDLNIAFMNELSMIFDKLDIDTKSVLEAAGTKWNFLRFTPGLVGGHCIGVDPYYLAYRAERMGYHPQIILSGRRINDDMGKFVAEKCVKKLIKNGTLVNSANVLILGLTFKENVSDIRNTKVIDIISELKDYGINVHVNDCMAVPEDVENEYNISLSDIEYASYDAVIAAVSHKEYLAYSFDHILKMYKNQSKAVLIDIKGMYAKEEAIKNGIDYWRL